MTIALLILSCKNPKYCKARAEQSLLLPSNIDIYYVQGHSKYPCDITQSNRIRVLQAPYGDNYEDIPLKMGYAFSYLRYFYDTIIKIDENLVINDFNRLISIVEQESICHPYGALKGIGGKYPTPVFTIEHGYKVNNTFLKVAPSYMIPIPYAGSCYYISSALLMSLNMKHFSTFISEDYAIGYWVKRIKNVDVYLSDAAREKIVGDREESYIFRAPAISVPGLEKYYQTIWDSVPEDPVCIVDVHGGLGNQLFQIMTGIEYSLKSRKRLLLRPSKNNIRPYYWNGILKRFKCIVINEELSTETVFREEQFHYKQIPHIESSLSIYGYFQSFKYFPTILADASKILFFDGQSILPENMVIVHARRGDSKSNIHSTLSNSYYEKAIEHMLDTVKHAHFILISDDDEYWVNTCVNLFKNQAYSIWTDNDEINTLSLMMSASNLIIANSTYSWWGAVLAGATNVVAPKIWFGPMTGQDTKDLYLNHWIVL